MRQSFNRISKAIIQLAILYINTCFIASQPLRKTTK
jgi:hypothetical protein